MPTTPSIRSSGSIFPADGLPRKRCHACRKSLPATTDYFHRAAKTRDGLSTLCIPCHRRAMMESYYRRRTARDITLQPELLASGELTVPPGYRVCTRCGACLRRIPKNFRITVPAHYSKPHRFAPRERHPHVYSELCHACESLMERKI